MSDGCSIYFTPVDRAWLGSPDFLREVARLFGVQNFKRLSVWHIPDTSADVNLSWGERAEERLELRNPFVEDAISAQITGAGHTTSMHLPKSETLTLPLGEATLADIPEELSEGWVPLYVVIHNGYWEAYNPGGDRTDGGACCIELGNHLGYPEEMQRYLQAFLQVPAVIEFQRQLETISAQPWTAVMELT